MFNNLFKVIFAISYIVISMLVIGTNIYTSWLWHEVILWAIFLVSYTVGRLLFYGKAGIDLDSFMISAVIFFSLNVWGVLLIKALDVISYGYLVLKLESIPYLNWIAYLIVIILALKGSKINIELIEE